VITGQASTCPFVPKERGRRRPVIGTAKAKSYLHQKTQERQSWTGIKEKWGNLTNDDLDKIEGHRDQLEGIIQERYGIAKDQVRKDVDAWLESV
jgi:uncharacterized protein YjbJ (UPF0337 family)